MLRRWYDCFCLRKKQRRCCRFPQTGEMKRMKLSMLLLLAILVIASSASAGLGYDSERIEDSYGTIVQRRLHDDGTVSVVYAKGRYLYLVTFANRKSISESY